jgi:hypothetical protein
VRYSAAPDAGSLQTYPSGEVIYFARIPYPATSGASLGVPTEVEAVMLHYARYYTAIRYAPDRTNPAMQLFQTGFRQLRVNESNEQGLDWSER